MQDILGSNTDILGWIPCLCRAGGPLALLLAEAFSGRVLQLPPPDAGQIEQENKENTHSKRKAKNYKQKMGRE